MPLSILKELVASLKLETISYKTTGSFHSPRPPNQKRSPEDLKNLVFSWQIKCLLDTVSTQHLLSSPVQELKHQLRRSCSPTPPPPLKKKTGITKIVLGKESPNNKASPLLSLVKIPQFEQMDKTLGWLIKPSTSINQSQSHSQIPKKKSWPLSSSVKLPRLSPRACWLWGRSKEHWASNSRIPNGEAQVSRRPTGWLSPKCLSESPKKGVKCETPLKPSWKIQCRWAKIKTAITFYNFFCQRFVSFTCWVMRNYLDMGQLQGAPHELLWK